jgi:hypothetical protein
MGPGGSNKTGSNLNDKGLNDLLFTAPSWKLATNKNKEYGVKNDVVARLIGTNCEVAYKYDYPSNIIVDEGTQLTDDVKTKVQTLYPYSRIFFIGDWNDKFEPYQCPCIKGKQLTFTDDNFQIIKMTKILRTSDNNLLNVCKYLRELIDGKESKEKMKQAIINKFKELNLHKQIIKVNDVEKYYTNEDYILASKHEHVDEWTKKFSGKFNPEKYLITKNSKEYSNGDVIWSENKPASSEIRHAFTVHQFQGETVEIGHKLFIDLRDNFLPQIIYTAVSRAKNIDQIYLVNI